MEVSVCLFGSLFGSWPGIGAPLTRKRPAIGSRSVLNSIHCGMYGSNFTKVTVGFKLSVLGKSQWAELLAYRKLSLFQMPQQHVIDIEVIVHYDVRYVISPICNPGCPKLNNLMYPSSSRYTNIVVRIKVCNSQVIW